MKQRLAKENFPAAAMASTDLHAKHLSDKCDQEVRVISVVILGLSKIIPTVKDNVII